MARLLFVDDDARILNSLNATFKRLHHVTTAESGDVALEKLRQESFDVIISDERMPGIKGLQLLAQVREQWPSTMRILLAGSLNVENVNKADIYRYVQKPWSLDDLSQIIDQAMIKKMDITSNDSIKEDTAELIAEPDKDFIIVGIGNDHKIKHMLSDSIMIDVFYDSAIDMEHKISKSLAVTVILLDLSAVNEACAHWMAAIHKKRPNLLIIGLGQFQDETLAPDSTSDLQFYCWEPEAISAEKAQALISKAIDEYKL